MGFVIVEAMTAATPEVPELKEAIERRMAELGLSPTDLATATGLTVQGLLNLRQGKRREYQRRLTGPVCKALGWTPDSIDRILAGGKARLARTPPAAPDVLVRLDELERLHAALASEVRGQAAALEDLAAMAHTHADGRHGEAASSGR